MLPKFQPSFLGFSLQSVIHIKIDPNTSILNAQIHTRMKGLSALTLLTRRKAALLSFLSVPPTPDCFFRRMPVFLHCRNCFCIAVSRPWLPLDALQQCYFTLLESSALLWPMTLVYPYPMAEVFSRLE